MDKHVEFHNLFPLLAPAAHPQQVGKFNYKQVADMFHAICYADRFGTYQFSAQLCDALQHCYLDWERWWGDGTAPHTPTTPITPTTIYRNSHPSNHGYARASAFQDIDEATKDEYDPATRRTGNTAAGIPIDTPPRFGEGEAPGGVFAEKWEEDRRPAKEKTGRGTLLERTRDLV